MICGSGAFRQAYAASRGRKPGRFLCAALLAGAGLAAVGGGAGRAETIGGALIKAYLTNPDISIERAETSIVGPGGGVAGSGDVTLKPRGYGVSANETVFNGNQTINSIRQAESKVFGAREQLRNTEQNTLLSGVTAYMDVLQDTAILDLDRNNVDVLK